VELYEEASRPNSLSIASISVSDLREAVVAAAEPVPAALLTATHAGVTLLKEVRLVTGLMKLHFGNACTCHHKVPLF
jgi:hypothetical protein